jgi:hypothetical protein
VVRALALALALTLALTPLTARAADQAPYDINVVVSQTGPAAFIGASVSKMLGILETVVNKQGGIKGRPIKFLINDDTSTPLTAVQFGTKLQSSNVPVILGPAFRRHVRGQHAPYGKERPADVVLRARHYAAGRQLRLLHRRYDRRRDARRNPLLPRAQLETYRRHLNDRCERPVLRSRCRVCDGAAGDERCDARSSHTTINLTGMVALAGA